MDDLDAIERFTGLYDRYCSRVYAYAVSRAGRQLADEVVSEVFLAAWRKVAELPDDPLPWLLVTARNVIGSEFRSAGRQESLTASSGRGFPGRPRTSPMRYPNAMPCSARSPPCQRRTGNC